MRWPADEGLLGGQHSFLCKNTFSLLFTSLGFGFFAAASRLCFHHLCRGNGRRDVQVWLYIITDLSKGTVIHVGLYKTATVIKTLIIKSFFWLLTSRMSLQLHYYYIHKSIQGVWFRGCFISCYMMLEHEMWHWNGSVIHTDICSDVNWVTIPQALNIFFKYKYKNYSDVTIAVFLPSTTGWVEVFPLLKMGPFPKNNWFVAVPFSVSFHIRLFVSH